MINNVKLDRVEFCKPENGSYRYHLNLYYFIYDNKGKKISSLKYENVPLPIATNILPVIEHTNLLFNKDLIDFLSGTKRIDFGSGLIDIYHEDHFSVREIAILRPKKQMTIAEIEKELGYSIEIKEETNHD